MYCGHSVPELAAPWTGERPATLRTQLEPDFRVRHRVVGDDPVDSCLLCIGRAQESATRGQVAEQVSDGDRRAERRTGRSERHYLSVFDLYAGAAVSVQRPCAQLNAGDRGDAWQRLATKSERGHGVQVFGHLQLAGGESLECEFHLVGWDAGPVVGDANILDAAAANLDAYSGRTGVQRVFHQLFYGRGGTLDHLPSRNLRRNFRSEELDGHELVGAFGRSFAARGPVSHSAGPACGHEVVDNRVYVVHLIVRS